MTDAMTFAYADPPYLGCGKRLYKTHHQDAAVWDTVDAHRGLIEMLLDEYGDGWALSCNPRDLQMYLQWMPNDVRIGAWCKTWHQIRPTSVQYAWEPVIFRGGRSDPKRVPMVRDWITANATRQKGLPGAKPVAFNRWILDLLNYQPGDTLHDLFPGTHGMQQVIDQGVLL